MGLISFGYRVNMDETPSPIDTSGFIVAYDMDGFLKQKDFGGSVSRIGAGSIGAQGPAGPVGPAGLTWSGYWVATQSYSTNYAVGYASASWWCISPIVGSSSNLGPDDDDIHWTLLAAQGSPGSQGPQGINGSDGNPGPAGINWIGNWVPDVYNVRDGVYYNGSSYVCIANNSLDAANPPFNNPTYWNLLALKGDTGDQDSYRFPGPLTVSLTGGKSFGRYTTGQTIPAYNLTVYEVLQLAIQESIPPGVTLSSSTTIAFNQTAINNILTYTYSINSLGATVSSTSLQWRRNNSGSWVVLATASNLFTFTHSVGDTAFNPQPFNYRYIVTDSQGATNSAIKNITPAPYSAPTATLPVVGPSISSPETNLMREVGNYVSSLTGTITRVSPLVDLVSYDLQYRKNSGGTWTTFTSSVCGSASAIIPSITHNEPTLSDSTSISYRVLVTDSYTQSSLETSTINFYKLIFYGPTSSVPGNSLQVRSLPNRIFASGPSASNPFTFYTGLTATVFSVAVPSPSTITVFDLDTSVTLSDYNLSSVLVSDFYGTTSSYNVYTETTGVPYSNHIHRVTIT